MKYWKKQAHQNKEEIFEVFRKWEEKYLIDIEKQKQENIELKI